MGAIAQQKGGETHKLTCRDTPTCHPCASGEDLEALPVLSKTRSIATQGHPMPKTLWETLAVTQDKDL